MMEEREDLRLSLSISTSESRSPSNLTLFPSLTAPAPSSKVQCAYSDEEDAGARSPVSTLSDFCGRKRSNREEETNDGEEDGYNSSKKLRLSKDQTVLLEESFKENSTLNPKQKQALAKQLNLRPRQVEVWFQNRRARTKLKQTEVDCEYLKRWCRRLAEENKRLQEEVMELRAANRASPIPSATNTIPSSAPLQLLPGYHLNLSAAADSNPWNLYFSQAN